MNSIGKIFIKFCTFAILLHHVAYSQYLPEELKTKICRTVAGNEIGTSVCFKDDVLGIFFLTCKHVLMDDAGNYADTVRFYRNGFYENGTIFSDTSYFAVAIRQDSIRSIIAYPGDIDLAIVLPYEDVTIKNPKNLYYHYLPADLIYDRDSLLTIVKPGKEVEIIGFEFKQPGTTQFYFSRFGRISLYPPVDYVQVIDGKPVKANFIILDISSRQGDSGGPVILHDDRGFHFIGVSAAASILQTYALVYPVHYIRQMLDIASNIAKK